MNLARRALAWWGDRPWPWRIAAAVAWAGLIWLLSSRPAGRRSADTWTPLLHNAAHLLVYAVLAVLAWFALARAAGAPEGRVVRPVVACVAAVAFGIADEIHQSFVPGRVASPGDVVTDLAGAVLGLACAAWLRQPRRAHLRLAAAALLAGCVAVASETFWL